MVADPIADLLVRLKNASSVGRDRVQMPYSKMRRAVADLLSREGYVGAVSKKNPYGLTVELRYNANGRPAISGTKRISKLSRRMYAGVREIRSIKQGHGTLVLSTPQGLMTDKEAREKRVGGETLFEIW